MAPQVAVVTSEQYGVSREAQGGAYNIRMFSQLQLVLFFSRAQALGQTNAGETVT